MSRLVERLAKKIKDDLGVEVDPKTFISIRPKPCYKSAGAWSWEMQANSKGISRVGSSWTAAECTRKNVRLVAAAPHPACWSNQLLDIVQEDI